MVVPQNSDIQPPRYMGLIDQNTNHRTTVVCILVFLEFLVVYNFFFFLVLRHQMMDKVQKYTSINANTPLSETYRSDTTWGKIPRKPQIQHPLKLSNMHTNENIKSKVHLLTDFGQNVSEYDI
jgi:hypothetical protein